MLRLTALLVTVTAMSCDAAEKKSVADRVREFSEAVRARLQPKFAAAGVPYPPANLTFIGLKQEKVLQIYASGPNGKAHYINAYPMQAASGKAGPKLRQGDQQVPEGFYGIDALNPNSRFHLSLHVSYPNDFDRRHAATEGRSNLGGEIMIHGNAVSIGCLAMGDAAAEDLFVLAALTGIEHIQVLLCPVDFRVAKPVEVPAEAPRWVKDLYGVLATDLRRYPSPG